MSSDINFDRREARRRRILENSENRLRSITGESCIIKSNSGSGLVEGNECFTHNEGLLKGEIPLEENNSYISPLNPLKFEGKTSFENLNYSHYRNTTSPVEVSENNDVSTINVFATNKISQIIYVAVAIVLRILIETNDSYFFVNSLVGAFILTKVGVTSVYGWQIPETSRLIGSFLLISGISSQKTNSFIFATSVFSNLVKEFAVLIFVFVFSDVFINALINIIL